MMNASEFLTYYSNRESIAENELNDFLMIISLLKIYFKKDFAARIEKQDLNGINSIIGKYYAMKDKYNAREEIQKYNDRKQAAFNERKTILNGMNQYFKNTYAIPAHSDTGLSATEKDIIYNYSLFEKKNYFNPGALDSFTLKAACSAEDAIQYCNKSGDIEIEINHIGKNRISILNNSPYAILLNLVFKSIPFYGGLAPDGTIYSINYNGIIHEWDGNSVSLIHTYSGHTRNICSVNLSSDGQKLLTASNDGTIILWKRSRNKKIAVFGSGENNCLFSLFTPDELSIAAAFKNGLITEFNIESGKVKNTFEASAARIINLFFLSDNILLCLNSRGDCITIDRTVNAVKKSFTLDIPDLISRCIHNPGNNTMLAGIENGDIIEYSLHDGRMLKKYRGHDKKITALELSQSGKRLLSASSDGIINEWDTEDGACLLNYKDLSGEISQIGYADKNDEIWILSSFGHFYKLDKINQRMKLSFQIPECNYSEIALDAEFRVPYLLPFEIEHTNELIDHIMLFSYKINT